MKVPFSDKILGIWYEVPERWRVEIISALHTFVGVFAFEILIQLDAVVHGASFPDSRNAIIALAIAIVRSATKNAFGALTSWAVQKWQDYKMKKVDYTQ